MQTTARYARLTNEAGKASCSHVAESIVQSVSPAEPFQLSCSASPCPYAVPAFASGLPWQSTLTSRALVIVRHSRSDSNADRSMVARQPVGLLSCSGRIHQLIEFEHCTAPCNDFPCRFRPPAVVIQRLVPDCGLHGRSDREGNSVLSLQLRPTDVVRIEVEISANQDVLLAARIPLAPIYIVKHQQLGPAIRLAVPIQQMDRANCPIEGTRLERAAVRLTLEPISGIDENPRLL